MRIFTFFLALITLSAFAANSILCRQALMTNSIGPVAFTFVRLASGILVLLPFIFLRNPSAKTGKSDRVVQKRPLGIRRSTVWPAVTLFGYALFFSLAYVRINVCAGALILFPSVQMTMLGISVMRGNRVTPIEWLGLAISIAGLAYLLSPGLAAPPLTGTILMIVAGVSWGIYSLLGKNENFPIFATARNFLFCLPGVILLLIVILVNFDGANQVSFNREGVILAIISGAVTSGMGYVLWYLAVRRLTTTLASVSQLVVPILAAVGGILFLGESLTGRLVIASILIIGGIVVTIAGRSRHPQASQSTLMAETAPGR